MADKTIDVDAVNNIIIDKGFKKGKLFEQLGISRTTGYYFLKGIIPDCVDVKKLAKILGVKTSEITKQEEPWGY